MAKFNLYAYETPPTMRATVATPRGGFTPLWWATSIVLVAVVFAATFMIAGL